MDMFFVNQKKHEVNGDKWVNTIHVKDTENDALHQFHAFMSTYGYGYAEGTDYVACSVEVDDGRCIKNEVDDRRPAPDEE